jgi:hypothetical protein
MELGMTDTGQPLFDLWRKQFEEGTQAWARLVSQTPAAPSDPTAFWRPLVEQWVQAWARMFAQTPASPEVATQWKQFLDQSVETWSQALGQAMQTEAFAQMLGRYLDQWLAVYNPARKAMDQSLDTALQTMNLASRSQLTAVARQIVELDERVERLEDGIAAVLKRLDEVARRPGPARPETSAVPEASPQERR